MSNYDDFNSDLDAILEEFSSYSSDYASAPEQEKPKAAPSPVSAPMPEAQEDKAEYYVDVSRLTDYWLSHQDSIKKKEASRHTQPSTPQRHSAVAGPDSFSPRFTPEDREYTRPQPTPKKKPQKRKAVEVDPDKVLSDREMERAAALRRKAEEKEAMRQTERSALKAREQDELYEQEMAEIRRESASSPIKTLVAALFALLGLLAFAWIGFNVHPDSNTATASKSLTKLELPSRLDVYMNNSASDALGDMAYIKKIYTIPENAPAPAPDPAAYGTTTDPAVIEQVITDAAELLDGQKTVWQPNLPFYPGTEMQYYRDDTILVIVWKEIIEERCATLAEVKIAHGSQFRRRLTEDTYGSSVQLYCSEMAAASNAVVAANADFYGYRREGVTVYQRQLFRNESQLDTCFITSSGDMLFAKAGQLGDDASVKELIEANDVVFSLSFGPVLVDNGELQYCPSYPIGEIDAQYSRSGIGMTDELHYLLMTVNHTDGRPRANVNQFGQFMFNKGCIKAFNLDGGQTSEIVMQGKPVNYVDFGAERTVTDIIYFATAIPESEVRR